MLVDWLVGPVSIFMCFPGMSQGSPGPKGDKGDTVRFLKYRRGTNRSDII